MRRTYPRVHTVLDITKLPAGTEIHLPGWSLHKRHNGYAVSDGAALIQIVGIPPEYLTQLNYPGDVVYGLEVHVRVERDEVDPLSLNYLWSHPDTILRYFEPAPITCNCGAIYTSFPSHHSDWCDVVQPE